MVENTEHRHLGLGRGNHPCGPLADGAVDFVFNAHGKTWVVDQVQHRHMKQITQVEMARDVAKAKGRST